MSAPIFKSVAACLQPLRVILLALALSVTGLSIAAIVLSDSGHSPPAAQTNVLLLVLPALAAGSIPVYWVVRTAVLGGARRRLEKTSQDDRPPVILGAFFTLTVIAGALAEGVGLFGGVAYLVTGRSVAGIASMASVLTLLMLFPTRSKVDRFTESVTGRLESLR